MAQRTEGINKSKLFYDGLLPGNIVRLRNYSFALIKGVSNNDEAARQVDPDQLLSVARRVIRQWGELINAAIDPRLERALEYNDDIAIVSPDGIYVDPYPMVLICNLCSRLDYQLYPVSDSDKMADAKKRLISFSGRYSIPCRWSGCTGRMKQLKFVSVHRCGAMLPLQTPPGARRSSNLKYESSGGGVFQSRFIDMDNGDKFNSLQGDCPSCRSLYSDHAQINLRATPVTNKDRLYPKNVQYLCLKEDTGKVVSKALTMAGGVDEPLTDIGKDIGQGIAGVLLGIVKSDELLTSMRDSLGPGGPDEGEIQELMAQLEKQRKMLAKAELMAEDDPEMVEMIRENATTKMVDIESKLKLAQGIFSSVAAYIANEELLTALVVNRRAMESALLEADFAKERQSIREYIKEVDCPAERDSLTNNVALMHGMYGVKDVGYFGQVNVVLASLGFTRELSSPPEGDNIPPLVLNAYEDLVSSRYSGKQMIYALPAQTEAIQVKLDPRKILAWCVKNAAWENPGNDVLVDEVKARAHLLLACPALTMNPEEVLSATKGLPLMASAPFHLLHSISHSLLSTIKPHTGYDEKSVMEYLMPMDFSILLYVTSVQNYTAGGLLTLFRHHLKDWFDDASNFALNCIFDPICSDRGAACSGCIQEVLGCETFNHGLSRSYIHGGPLDQSNMIMIPEGFWS
jgi:hypothetical protein